MRKLTSARSIFVASVVLGAGLVFFAGSQGGRVVKASQGSDTYLLSDFEIQYPYTDPRDQVPDASKAVVRYRSSWSNDRYPGLVGCQLTLMDASGNVVGSHTFDLSSATDVLPEPVSSEPINVSGPPASAEGFCEGGRYSSGAGYSFGAPGISRRPADPGQAARQQATISIPVGWSGAHPGTRTCFVTVTFSDGSSDRMGPFNLHLSKEGPFEFSVPLRDGVSAQDADVECESLRGDQ